jgi:hypothetical protein
VQPELHYLITLSGHKIGWQYHQGSPLYRITLARRMAEHLGFEALLTFLRDPEQNWLGVDTLNIFFKAFCEVS